MDSGKINKNAEILVREIITKMNEIAADELEAFGTALQQLNSASQNYLEAEKNGKTDLSEEKNARDMAAAEAEKTAGLVWKKLAPIVQHIRDERLTFLREYLFGFCQAICSIYAMPSLNCCSPDEFRKLIDFNISKELLDYINQRDIEIGVNLYQYRQPLKTDVEKH